MELMIDFRFRLLEREDFIAFCLWAKLWRCYLRPVATVNQFCGVSIARRISVVLLLQTNTDRAVVHGR